MRSRLTFYIILLVVAGSFVQLGALANSVQAADRLKLYHEDYRQLSQKYMRQLSELLEESRKTDDPELSGKIEKHLILLSSKQKQFSELPKKLQPDIPDNMPEAVRELHFQFRTISDKYAGDLYLLARRSIKISPTFTFELLNILLEINPDHQKARSLRGYVRQGDQWLTPFERDQFRAGKVEHPRFGWLKKSYVQRYEQGERNFMGNWISEEKEAEIRRDFHYAWTVRTEHFQIKTNHSLEKGVELGRKLEIFYDYFKQTFAAFYNSPEQIKQFFESTTGRSKTRSQLYKINHFRSKDEYVKKLIKRVPQIAITNGLYQLEDRTAYFYYDPLANNDATVFHEVTHQLMYESHLRQRDIANNGHFWIIEGIANYTESFHIKPNGDGYTYDGFTYEVGDPRFVRFYWARKRLLEEDYFVPQEKFSRLGRIVYQTGSTPLLQKRYSQAAGLAHFYMHYQNGKYRNALMIYMAQIYHSSPRVRSRVRGLDVLTGVDYPTLDRQYREYLQDQLEEVGDDEVIQ